MNTDKLIEQARPLLKAIKPYRALLFFVMLAALYGYIIVKINSFNNVTAPDITTSTNSQVHLDKNVISKIEDLQENSVSVKTLFDQARDNPFNE